MKLIGTALFDLGPNRGDDKLWDYLLYRQSNVRLRSVEKLVVLNDGLQDIDLMHVMRDFQPALIHLLKPSTPALFCTIGSEEGVAGDGLWTLDLGQRIDPPEWHVPLERLIGST